MAPTLPLNMLSARSEHMKMALALRSIIYRRDVTSNSVPLHRLMHRSVSSGLDSDKMINALIAILVLVFVSLILVSALFLFRRSRRLKELRNQSLPCHDSSRKRPMAHRPLTIDASAASKVVLINCDEQPMLQNPDSPPHSPDNVPEIHITFPDEQDDDGRRKSGRVLIVRVGDNAAVGFEPVREEQLPAYEKEANGHFQSIDMDTIGGLKEKPRDTFK